MPPNDASFRGGRPPSAEREFNPLLAEVKCRWRQATGNRSSMGMIARMWSMSLFWMDCDTCGVHSNSVLQVVLHHVELRGGLVTFRLHQRAPCDLSLG